MSSINCNVINCSHNDSGTCYANKISVSGKKSRTSTHTCCSSFLDSANYSNLTNNTNGGGACSFIGCNVKTCTHNAGTVCALNNIAVASVSSKANLYSETYCSSFKCNNLNTYTLNKKGANIIYLHLFLNLFFSYTYYKHFYYFHLSSLI